MRMWIGKLFEIGDFPVLLCFDWASPLRGTFFIRKSYSVVLLRFIEC